MTSIIIVTALNNKSMKHLNTNNTLPTQQKRSRKVETVFLVAIFLFACFGTYHICKNQGQAEAEKVEYQYSIGSR